ncbi:MAG: hypothetical protein LKF99_03070 [Bifidobacterium sp.]|jgi:alpha-glucosidase|nr:hypothetical protein [Bifidobacterium sp.]
MFQAPLAHHDGSELYVNIPGTSYRRVSAVGRPGALRHAHTALQQGGLRWYRHDADSVIFERADSKETLLIEVSKADHTPLISSLNAINLFDKADLVKGEPMPKEGPTFHIWQVTD